MTRGGLNEFKVMFPLGLWIADRNPLNCVCVFSGLFGCSVCCGVLTRNDRPERRRPVPTGEHATQ